MLFWCKKEAICKPYSFVRSSRLLSCSLFTEETEYRSIPKSSLTSSHWNCPFADCYVADRFKADVFYPNLLESTSKKIFQLMNEDNFLMVSLIIHGSIKLSSQPVWITGREEQCSDFTWYRKTSSCIVQRTASRLFGEWNKLKKERTIPTGSSSVTLTHVFLIGLQ